MVLLQYMRYVIESLYNITNTTNNQYSIEGLLPHTNYIIEVRACTSIGPGDWNIMSISTSEICKIIFCRTTLIFS